MNKAGEVTRAQRDLSRSARFWLVEVVFAAVVAFAGLLVLNHLATTRWLDAFLYNADSLVLPLIKRSIADRERFRWVFSSQLFIFPEAPLYWLSSLFTDSARVALAANAIVNLLTLYVLLRVNSSLIAHHARHQFLEIVAALSATGLFVIFVLLEPSPDINGTAMATLFVFTTYYSGVILAGLAAVALVLWVTYSFRSMPWEHGLRSGVFAVATVVLGGAASFSNPLYTLQVMAPAVAALVILLFANRLRWRGFWILAGASVAGVLGGQLLRRIFARFISAEADRYVRIDNIPDSIGHLYRTVTDLLATPEGGFKLLLVSGILLLTIGSFMYGLYAQSRPVLSAHVSTSEVFITGFVSISAVSLLAGEVATGSLTTRYLTPLFVFPLLAYMAGGIHLLQRLLFGVDSPVLRRPLSRFAIAITAAACLGVVVAGLSGLGPVVRMVRGAGYTVPDCLHSYLRGRDDNGVASFWMARPLQLYGGLEGDTLQVRNDLTILAWLVNLDSYAHKKFSYVLIDNNWNAVPPRLARTVISPKSVQSLGEPASVVICEAYTIYDFAGTSGERVLTERVASSLTEIRNRRGF